jgi:hypothetical protein
LESDDYLDDDIPADVAVAALGDELPADLAPMLAAGHSPLASHAGAGG